MNWELLDVKAGFIKGMGTRDHIANIRWITEKNKQITTNISFIDYAKAFDCVKHNKLWKILKKIRISDYLIYFLSNLYAGQEATVRPEHGTTGWFKTGKGVQKGSILSPCLFNLYAECAAAAKSLQSCPTLCDPIDDSPPGSPIPAECTACETLYWTNHKLESRLLGETSTTSCMQMIPP